MAEELPSCATLQAALATCSVTGSQPSSSASDEMGPIDVVADAKYRLSCVRHVRELWLADGGNYDVAALAPHYTDGTAWALERFLYYGAELADAPANPAARACAIPTVHADDLTYDEFFKRHLLGNHPVVVRGLTSDWNAARDWVTQEGTPDVLALASMFPHAIAPVVGIWNDDPTRATSKQIRVRDYAKWFAQKHGNKQTHFDAGDHETRDLDGEKLYLKDWHFMAEHGATYSAYCCPVWFRDDWLHPAAMNGIAHAASSGGNQEDFDDGRLGRDHRFVYLGPAGSTTRMHCDVMASYSWSVNVCGTKRWQLLPPSATPLLFDSLGDQMATDLTSSCSWYGGLETARAHAVEIIQHSGEAIFVPSGWHHCVENVEDTLSINHNWINACNLHWAVEHVLSRLQADLEKTEPSDGSNSNRSKHSNAINDDAARKEARLLAAVVDEAAARSCRICQTEESGQTAKLPKAVYDLRVAQAALDRLHRAGVYTMRATTRSAIDETQATVAAVVAAAAAGNLKL